MSPFVLLQELDGQCASPRHSSCHGTAPDFIFGDHIEDLRRDGCPDVRPSESEQDCSLLYPRSFYLKELAPDYSLQRMQ